jgi:hypothetical protein
VVTFCRPDWGSIWQIALTIQEKLLPREDEAGSGAKFAGKQAFRRLAYA